MRARIRAADDRLSPSREDRSIELVAVKKMNGGCEWVGCESLLRLCERGSGVGALCSFSPVAFWLSVVLRWLGAALCWFCAPGVVDFRGHGGDTVPPVGVGSVSGGAALKGCAETGAHGDVPRVLEEGDHRAGVRRCRRPFGHGRNGGRKLESQHSRRGRSFEGAWLNL